MREETKNFRARMAISLYYFVPVIILLATSFVFFLSSKAATGSETQILVLIWQVGVFVGALRLFIFCEGNHLGDLLSIIKKSNKRTFAQPDRR